MCYTISIPKTREALEQRYGVKMNPDQSFDPSFLVSAFTFPPLPVLTQQKPDQIQCFHWGLIPYWTRDESSAGEIRTKTINARAEGLEDKPSFRKPFRENRCLIPVMGFFEWHHATHKKIPCFIRLKQQEIFSLAGICDSWTNPATGEIIRTFSVVTTPANPLMEKIHNSKKRMPLILSPEEEKTWIDKDLSLKDIKSLCKPFDEKFMVASTVSPLAGSPRLNRNTPEVIEPVPYAEFTIPPGT